MAIFFHYFRFRLDEQFVLSVALASEQFFNIFVASIFRKFVKTRKYIFFSFWFFFFSTLCRSGMTVAQVAVAAVKVFHL